jgi:alpha-beta hydrolase superfamily lysophospholipase
MTVSHITQWIEASPEVVFAGDKVRLAGQMDYPASPPPQDGYPLLFILHHAGTESRDWYTHFADIGVSNRYAVFRWDKRGTGRSGASGLGSSTQDAVNAYEIALDQPRINRKRVVILAQGAGTGLLGSSFGLFARIQAPYAVILASNMLDDEAVLAVDARLRIVVSYQDWNPWQRYGQKVCESHNAAYKHGAEYAVVSGGDRKLMMSGGELHPHAEDALTHWLKQLCPISKST